MGVYLPGSGVIRLGLEIEEPIVSFLPIENIGGVALIVELVGV